MEGIFFGRGTPERRLWWCSLQAATAASIFGAYSHYFLALGRERRLTVLVFAVTGFAVPSTTEASVSPGALGSRSKTLVGLGLRGIKLHQIGYVLAAAECRSFRRAARRLNVEQSSVSRRVRELEIQLGASIFERSRGGVRLTEAGERFVVGAAAAVGQFQEAAQIVREAGRAQAAALRVGVGGPLGEGALQSWLRRLASEPKAPRITLQEASGERHLSDLEAGRLDIAFMIGGTGGHNLRSAPAWLERVFLATPVDHPLAARTSVAWEDFAAERLVFSTDAYGEALQALVHQRSGGRSVEIVGQGAGRESLQFLVQIGQGLTVVMAEKADESGSGVALTPVRRERLQVSAIWSPRNVKVSLRRFLRLAALADGPS